jgi:hypothetical protein
VSSDTDVVPQPGGPEARPGVYLNKERFDLICTILGHTSNAAKARLLNVVERTVDRARNGDPTGERFIAAVLTEFGKNRRLLAKHRIGVKFEDIFVIRDKKVES